MSKRRWLTRCRNRAAAGPTRYVLDMGHGIRAVVPRRVLLLRDHTSLLPEIERMALAYRKVLGL